MLMQNMPWQKKELKLFFDAKNILNEKYNEIIGYNSLGLTLIQV